MPKNKQHRRDKNSYDRRAIFETVSSAETSVERFDDSTEAPRHGAAAATENLSVKQRLSQTLRGRWWIFAMIGVLSLSALGAGLKYLEQDAARQISERNRATFLAPAQESALSKVNPFLAAASATPTPQLSKEYVYAGSRMLAVEDANASAATPPDLAVWRPSSGVWYVMGANQTILSTTGWGSTGDTTVPGDYDGDGKTDYAVYRPTNSTWYLIKSSDPNNPVYTSFGSADDVPVPADYDGDHRTDIAVFRSSNQTVYVLKSSDQTVQLSSFGLSTDQPVPADYDGDGRADIAVFRQTNATFYVYRSSDAQVQSGQLSQTATTGKPVPADYDGDGKADYAMRDGTNWIVFQTSSNTFLNVAWQQSGDPAVQNDYDGDGKVDIAVWRPSGAGVGNWYIRQSSRIGQPDELRLENWGTTGDVPVPAFWRR